MLESLAVLGSALTPALLMQGLVLLVLLGLSGFYSGSEVAFLAFPKYRRRQLVAEEHPRIGAVERLMERPQRFLVTILIANNVVNVAASALATSVAIGMFGSSGVGIATGVMTFLILTFGEITPKAYVSQHAEHVALRVAPVILLTQRILYPFVAVFDRFTSLLFGTFGGTPSSSAAAFRSEDELKTIISLGTEEGILEEEEEEMLHSVIEFADTTAKEIMAPRTDITAVANTSTLDEVKSLVIESGYSRIPVFRESLDNVIGILYVKDMLTHLLSGRGDATVEELMREPFFVPETKKLDELLSEMQDRGVHMATVIDEFGGTAGVLTLEDVLEEIVGEIFDEYDLRHEPIRELRKGVYVVDARTHVDDVNETVGIRIPEEDGYDTVGGYVQHVLGRFGKEGEVVAGDNYQIVVEKTLNRRILRVRVVLHDGVTASTAVGSPDARDGPPARDGHGHPG